VDPSGSKSTDEHCNPGPKVEKMKIFDTGTSEELDAVSQAGTLSLQPKLLHFKIEHMEFFGT
jgi:hypothetical protein